MPYPPEVDPELAGAGGLLYPPEVDPELAGAVGLLYPPDEGLLYKPEDDGREEDDEDLDDEDEEPLAATTSVTETNAKIPRTAIPTRNNCFFICC